MLQVDCMDIRLAPAAAALLCSLSAAASGSQRSFLVGAVVAASARVSSTRVEGNVVRLRLEGRGTAAPRILAGGRLMVVAGSSAIVPAPARGNTVITVLY